MYICIFVYFRIPTFSVSWKTHFQDSHFRRFTENTFSGFPLSAPAQTYFRFWVFYDFWCPEPWEIVGIGGNRVKLSPEPRESWEIVGRSWEMVGNGGNGAQSLIPAVCPPNSPISLYITHTHAHTELLFPHLGAGGLVLFNNGRRFPFGFSADQCHMIDT